MSAGVRCGVLELDTTTRAGDRWRPGARARRRAARRRTNLATALAARGAIVRSRIFERTLMPAYKDKRGRPVAFRKWIELPHGKRIRVSGTPPTGEIRVLQWGDVRDGQLTARRSLDNETNEVIPPKHNKARTIPASPRIRFPISPRDHPEPAPRKLGTTGQGGYSRRSLRCTRARAYRSRPSRFTACGTASGPSWPAACRWGCCNG